MVFVSDCASSWMVDSQSRATADYFWSMDNNNNNGVTTTSHAWPLTDKGEASGDIPLSPLAAGGV